MITNSVSFATAKNHEAYLIAALEELGWTVTRQGNSIYYRKGNTTGSYINGQFNTRGVLDVDAVKQKFSRNVVKAAAKKFGWQFKEASNGKISITKRS